MNKSKYCTFYMIRHGQTDWNAQKIIQGHTNIPINENGINHAKEHAKRFKNIKFDHIFSSDLKRTKQTAEIVATEQKLAVKTTKLLRERNWGSLEGKSRTSLKDFDIVYKGLTDEQKRTYRAVVNSENDEELAGRYITFLREVAINNPKKTILIVGHGSAITTFLIHIGYLNYSNSRVRMPHEGLVKFRSDGVDFFVDEVLGVKNNSGYSQRISDK